MNYLSNYKKYLPFVFVLILFFGMRLPSLGNDILNSDAIRWHKRSEWFLNALRQREFADTYQHYQPGVTLMWLNTVPKYLDFELQLRNTSQPKTLEHAGYFPKLHLYSKLSLVIALAVLFGIQLFFISKLFSNKVAFVFGVLMSVEPYLVGIDRYMHLTSLEVYSAFASFLALMYWSNNRKLPALICSAGLFSFSVLSKLTTLGLVPFFAGYLIYDFCKSKDVRPLITFGAASLFSVIFLWPALWVIPREVILNLYDAIFNAVSTDIRGEEITGWLSLFYYDIILALRMSPVTYGLVLLAIVNFKKLFDNRVIRILLLFVVVYWLVLTIPAKKIDRYSIALFPPILLLVAYFTNSLALKKQQMIYTLVALYTGYSIAVLYPVYSAHYSPIFGGYKTALKVGVYDNSGEYFAQAAQYLNEFGRNITVYVPHNTDTFSYFYKGKVAPEFNYSVDYVVVSTDRTEYVPKMCFQSKDKSFKTPVYIYKCN